MKVIKLNKKIAIIMTAIVSAVLFILFLKYIPNQLQSSTSTSNRESYNKSSIDWIESLKTQTVSTELTNYVIPSIAQNQKKTANGDIIVVINFQSLPSKFEVSKAALKYNKNFAFSFTLDDGKKDAFTAGFPLLNGGLSAETGQSYPGLFITDGCGNKIPFRAGIAITSVSPTNNQDPHDGNTPGSISWENVRELYDNQWDILNHSYSHVTGPGTDYNAQVNKNINYVKSKTGITMTEFVIPSGDINYADYAFAAGMKAVYNQSNFPGGDGFQIDPPIELNKFKMYRQFLSDDNYQTYAGKVDAIAQKSSPTAHYWYSEFTHHISTAQQGGSLLFPTFKYHMEYLEKIYGSKGSDIMWMAPLQEVYEYLLVRDKSVITNFKQGATLTLTIDFNDVPKDLSKYAMTFNVASDVPIESVECENAKSISFNATGQGKLINIDFERHPLVINSILNPGKDNFASISVFPNPVENEINISSIIGEMRNSKVSLINEKGIEYPIAENLTISDKTSIDLRKWNLPKGVYILKVQPEGKKPFEKTILKE